MLCLLSIITRPSRRRQDAHRSVSVQVGYHPTILSLPLFGNRKMTTGSSENDNALYECHWKFDWMFTIACCIVLGLGLGLGLGLDLVFSWLVDIHTYL